MYTYYEIKKKNILYIIQRFRLKTSFSDTVIIVTSIINLKIIRMTPDTIFYK